MGGDNICHAKTLRRLRGKQLIAVLRACDLTIRPAPQRICNGQTGRGTIALHHALDHPINHGAADTRARRIVDQHRLFPAQMIQTIAHRTGPIRTAHHQGDALRLKRFGVFHIARMHHHHDLPHTCMALKGCNRVVNHTPRPKGPPLLGHSAPRTGAAPGGDDQGGNTHVKALLFIRLVLGKARQRRNCLFSCLKFRQTKSSTPKFTLFYCCLTGIAVRPACLHKD